MKVIDSVGWIEFLSTGDPDNLYSPYILDPLQVVTPTIVMYEVFKHMSRIVGEDGAEQAAAQMKKTLVVPLDDALAFLAAEMSAKHKLPMADAIVYATARHLQLQVVTADKHFEGLPGVELVAKPDLNKDE